MNRKYNKNVSYKCYTFIYNHFFSLDFKTISPNFLPKNNDNQAISITKTIIDIKNSFDKMF